jgi:hypothetical protein
MSLKSLDPGIRRDDGKVINQRFPSLISDRNKKAAFRKDAAFLSGAAQEGMA